VAKARRAGNGAPFASVEEVARRAGVGRRALEALAAADAFAGIAVSRRGALWQAGGVERIDDMPLFQAAATAFDDSPLLPEPDPALPPQHEGEAVVEDYTATGLTLRSHPLALLRPALDGLGLADTRHLNSARPGSWVHLPGLVLMRQRPGTAKGIVFVTVEDEFGSANLVVYSDVGARDRAALIGARLLVAEGRVERETEHAEVPIVHLICRRLVDRSDLLDRLLAAEGSDSDAWGKRALGRADEVCKPDPASAAAAPPRLPRSRDFR
jgi:error-prone DNA polymerase